MVPNQRQRKTAASDWEPIQAIVALHIQSLDIQTPLDIQWGEQVFDRLPILQVFLLTKHVEVCNFYHRYTSTVRDGI